jgi:hypothetical protein
MRRALAMPLRLSSLVQRKAPFTCSAVASHFATSVVLQYSLRRQALPCRAFDDVNRFPHFTVQQDLYNKNGKGESLRAETECPASETRWTRVASATEIYDISRFPFIQGRPRRTPGTLPRHTVLERAGQCTMPHSFRSSQTYVQIYILIDIYGGGGLCFQHWPLTSMVSSFTYIGLAIPVAASCRALGQEARLLPSEQ